MTVPDLGRVLGLQVVSTKPFKPGLSQQILQQAWPGERGIWGIEFSYALPFALVSIWYPNPDVPTFIKLRSP